MVSESDIPILSSGRYAVDSSGNFTPDMYTAFLGTASAKILMDAPNLTGALKDRAIGLLILHQYETGLGRTHLKSVSTGSGQTTIDEAGSSWMKEYREIITSYLLNEERNTYKSKVSLYGITHSDADTRGL